MIYKIVGLAIAWCATHPADCIMFVCATVQAVVSEIPLVYVHKPYVGFVIRMIDRLSVLTHSTAAGTLKLPGVPSLVVKAAEQAAGANEAP